MCRDGRRLFEGMVGRRGYRLTVAGGIIGVVGVADCSRMTSMAGVAEGACSKWAEWFDLWAYQLIAEFEMAEWFELGISCVNSFVDVHPLDC